MADDADGTCRKCHFSSAFESDGIKINVAALINAVPEHMRAMYITLDDETEEAAAAGAGTDAVGTSTDE